MYKYLKITADFVWGTNNLTRDDLVGVRTHKYDLILNLVDMTSYNADKNEWEPIQGELEAEIKVKQEKVK